ncbi:hypothetical protein LDENG_00165560 [Lucifuga dentata]|nr:hypothetical protein LDENG_00165560 [Lucifuga dentata]
MLLIGSACLGRFFSMGSLLWLPGCFSTSCYQRPKENLWRKSTRSCSQTGFTTAKAAAASSGGESFPHSTREFTVSSAPRRDQIIPAQTHCRFCSKCFIQL